MDNIQTTAATQVSQFNIRHKSTHPSKKPFDFTKIVTSIMKNPFTASGLNK